MNEIDVYSQPSYSDNIKLYHNTRDYRESRLLKFKFRDRPRDTDVVIHNIVNSLSLKKFGIPIRNLFFVYVSTTNRTAKQMRAVPLGDDVRYFYHPDIDDMTHWFMDMLSYKDIRKLISNMVDEDEYATDDVKIFKILNSSLTRSNNMKSLIEDLANNLHGYVGNPMEFTRKILKFIIKKLKEYVDGIVEVSDVEQLTPALSGSEVMIYAPSDIYLISTIKN